MRLFHLLTKRGLVMSTRFRFVGLRTCVIQEFYTPKTDDLIIASNVIYIAKYFRVGHASAKAIMLNYLKEVATESVRFERDASTEVYSHNDCWYRIVQSLTPFVQRAANHVFSSLTGAPVYYALGNADYGKVYGEYHFRLAIIAGVPSDFMKISWGSSKL